MNHKRYSIHSTVFIFLANCLCCFWLSLCHYVLCIQVFAECGTLNRKQLGYCYIFCIFNLFFQATQNALWCNLHSQIASGSKAPFIVLTSQKIKIWPHPRSRLNGWAQRKKISHNKSLCVHLCFILTEQWRLERQFINNKLHIVWFFSVLLVYALFCYRLH